MSGQNTKLLSVDEVAKMFGTSTDAVRGWLKRGTLPGKKIGRRVFVEAGVLEALKPRAIRVNK
jgi:excisionase family DNA binding protein